MNQSINILHISDFHLNKRWHSVQDSVASAFKADVARLSDGIIKPDIIVVTGDLANAADDSDIYGAFLDRLLAELTDVTKCSDRRVFFCPGNHDAHRSALRDTAILGLHRELQEKIKKDRSISEDFENGRLRELAAVKFRAFGELESIIASEQRKYGDGVTTVYQVPESSCYILSINTALMTHAGLDGVNDERMLFVPEESVSLAIASIPAGNPVIAILHHPLSWLTEENEKAVRQLLERRCSMQLFGHVHDPRPSQVTSVSGNLMLSQAGALYAGRNRYNGYGILCHDLSSCDTTAVLRTYFEKRVAFDEATDVAAKGLFHSSQAARAQWLHKSRAIDLEKYWTWLKDEKHKELKNSFNAGLVDKPLCDVFVSPPMFASAPSVQTDLESQAAQVEEAIKLNDVIQSAANYTFFGKQEYGKTSLLRQIAYQTLCRVDELDRPRLPIVLSFDDISPSVRRIEKLILAALHGVNPPFDLEQILSDGLICLLVDDVNFADVKRSDVLKGFIDRFPKNRYIISSVQQEGERFSAAATLDVSVPFRSVTLNHFSRRDMRQLVEKWDNHERLDRESILNRLSKELANINVPFTAVNGTILLSIYEQQSNFTPINRAVLVERFIEVLLEKRSLQDAARKTFDFRNKVHLLAHLSEIMARNDSYILDYEQVVKIFDQYFSKMGLNQSGKGWVDQFVLCRILAPRPDERVSFRYRAFLEYFIASRMDDDTIFCDWVLEEERHLTYINEIQYFAGKVRTDQRLLDLIGERFRSLTKAMLSDESIATDLRLLETFQLPDPKRSKDILAELESQMNLPPLSAAERDEILDGEIPKDIEDDKRSFDPRPKTLAPNGWWGCCSILEF